MLIALLWIVSLVCWLWLVVRVFRASGALSGIIALLLWPLAIVDVVRHWKDDANSVAWPWFATLLASVALYAFALRGINEFVAEQDVRLAKAAGSPMQSFQDEDDPVSDEIRLRQAFEQLEVQRGIVTIGAAHATLSIPAHFRLVPRRSIEALSTKLGGGPVEPDLFGWLVHDSVDLADDDAWFIAASYSPIGHVSASDAEDLSSPELIEANRKLTARYAGGEYAFDAFEHVPAWREDIGTLAWGETLEYTDEPEKLIDCYAAKPTRVGVIEFMVEYMPKSRSELCLRSVRLMAASTRLDSGWGWEDYSFFRDSRAGADFADLVTGATSE